MNKAIKVLYVDDEPINTTLFEISFKNKFSVITAKNGLHGLDVLNANPDSNVILSDMKMPVMDGLEFAEKAREKFPDKKFFILTGFDISDEIEKAIKDGVITKYFRKPLNMKEIESSINEVVG